MNAPLLIPQIFVSLGAFLLFVLLVGLTYEAHNESGKVSEAFAYPDRPKLSLGTFYVTEGQQPMQGIRMLKEVLDENPSDTSVIRTLGDFSQRSGQFEKAAERYEDLLKLTSVKYSKQRVNDYARLEFFYIQAGKVEEALRTLDKMEKEFSSDQGLVEAIKTRRQEIKLNFKI